MSSCLVMGRWRRAAVAFGVVWTLNAADVMVERAAAAPVAPAAITYPATPAAVPFVLMSWAGCWRCGGFAGWRHPFFFHRPLFLRDRSFVARRFFHPFRFDRFADRLGFP